MIFHRVYLFQWHDWCYGKIQYAVGQFSNEKSWSYLQKLERYQRRPPQFRVSFFPLFFFFSLSIFSLFEIGSVGKSLWLIDSGFIWDFADQYGESSWDWRCQVSNMQGGAETRGWHLGPGNSWLRILQEVTLTDSFTYFLLFNFFFFWV